MEPPRNRTWLRWAWLVAALALCGAWAASYVLSSEAPRAMVLLLPQARSGELPVAQAWRDAAQEEGLSVTTMTDDEFMRFGGDRRHIAGVILPDSVHREASDLLVNQLYDYVHGGGRLFLAFDAGVHAPNQVGYVGPDSRLSRLAGVRYALYHDLREQTFADDRVLGSRAAEQHLGLQPGKLDFKHSAQPPLGELTTYGYPRLHYPHFRTQPASEAAARVLLQSPAGDVMVSQHRFGDGEVLFVNLPLGYLKTRTDGHLLHRLLNHFAVGMLRQPRLAAVPQGVGGMVLNLHIDSNAAQRPLLQLEQEGWFDRGPYSLHLTAGPDTFVPGDHLGIDLDHNPDMVAFLRRQLARGHEVGNHGGWGHNIFGNNANDSNQATYEPFLQLNHDSVSSAMQRPARSYSAPMGNQPAWSTHWLEAQGFKAYYFTGDSGLGPTRAYFEGQRPTARLWAFPVTNLYQIATFEELQQQPQPRSDEDMAHFLEGLPHHVADARVARLFYFHPPAAARYRHVLARLDRQAQALADRQRFRWYTMERLADFMDQREQVRWQVTLTDTGQRQLVARSAADLAEMSWIFPLETADGFEVVTGKASVRRDAADWVVTAGAGQTLVVHIHAARTSTARR
ncbi:hypothetical protein [Hydrogenophaga sp. OTU3427]|uniref:hypothetical protein n=1 Tax=Hydrogenophaga sp. OTU3427 TaxID=3043856 RepID=UPI00313C26F4